MKNKITLNFNGKEIEFFFGLSFLGEFLSKNDIDLQGIFNKISNDSYSFIPKLMFASYKHNCQRKDLKVELKAYELSDLIEETNYFKDGSESSKFVEPFLQSIIDSLPKQEETNDKTPKKK